MIDAIIASKIEIPSCCRTMNRDVLLIGVREAVRPDREIREKFAMGRTVTRGFNRVFLEP